MERVEKLNFGRFEVEILASEAEALYLLSGDLDEKFEYKKIPKILRPVIRFKLGGVRTVNSCGVREWVFLMREFSDVPALLLEECSVPLIDQFNIVPQMLGRSAVRSFFAPYYCPTCEEEVTCLVETDKNRSRLLARLAPELAHTCGTAMEFDALEDCYFHQIDRFFKG